MQSKVFRSTGRVAGVPPAFISWYGLLSADMPDIVIPAEAGIQ